MNPNHPQRITPPAPIGSLLDRTASRALAPKTDAGKDENHLALVRQCPCLSCGHDPCGEAAHVKFTSFAFGRANKLGKRPHDCDALPLCREDHLIGRNAQHKGDEEAFWQALGIEPYAVARDLYDRRGDLTAMRMVVMVAIANRDKK